MKEKWNYTKHTEIKNLYIPFVGYFNICFSLFLDCKYHSNMTDSDYNCIVRIVCPGAVSVCFILIWLGGMWTIEILPGWGWVLMIVLAVFCQAQSQLQVKLSL